MSNDYESIYDRRQAYLQHKIAKRAVAVSEQAAQELIVRKGSSTLQVIMVRAKKEAEAALAAMIDVDPNDARRIAFLQGKVQIFRDMAKFIADAISEGDSARQELEESDKAEIAELVTEFEGQDDT